MKNQATNTKSLTSRRTLMVGVLGGLGLLALPSTAKACGCCGAYQALNFPEWDTLNVRSGPGTDFPVQFTLEYGECGLQKLDGRQGKWVEISDGERSGWVNKKYLHWRD